MNFFRTIIISFLVAALSAFQADACTSALVSAKASGTGRPLMWKHRDSNADNSFVERVEAKGGKLGYVALFDAGDTDLRQAWMGMNDAGFALMNTASYNLQPDTAKFKDQEGYLMAAALQACRSVNDFEKLIKILKKPLGVQANFGVMDAMGGLAYFEVNDNSYQRFDVDDSEAGFLIRTNFSQSGEKGGGYGYIRYANVLDILKPEIEANAIYPESFIEKASRSFWHSLLKKDYLQEADAWVVDQDFIPRASSSASIVIEGVTPDMPVSDMVMWTALGYPPLALVMPVTLKTVPPVLRPTQAGATSVIGNSMKELKKKVFPIKTGNGPHYIDMGFVRSAMPKIKQQSEGMYEKYRNGLNGNAAAQPAEEPSSKK